VGTEWSSVRASVLGDWDYRIVFSKTIPYIELIEGPPDSPWDCREGARFDHLGWWSNSIEVTSRRWVEQGLPKGFDACMFGRAFAYHEVSSIGSRFEVVDASAQPGFIEAWDSGGQPMPALDC
jgi:hypothetical protein